MSKSAKSLLWIPKKKSRKNKIEQNLWTSSIFLNIENFNIGERDNKMIGVYVTYMLSIYRENVKCIKI